jgi:hypothetical protein
VGCKPGGNHVKMHTQKLDSSKTQAVRAKIYREDKLYRWDLKKKTTMLAKTNRVD